MNQTKKGQVWIETVLYTLIGLALLGLVLAFLTPKITATKDKLVVEQTIESLNTLDEKISEVLQAPGNRRIIDFTMKRGELYINSSLDNIVFVISDLSEPYSQPGVEIEYGRIKILSETGQKTSSVSLTLNYENDVRYDGTDEVKKFSASSTPYRFSIENLGKINNSAIDVVNIQEVSGA